MISPAFFASITMLLSIDLAVDWMLSRDSTSILSLGVLDTLKGAGEQSRSLDHRLRVSGAPLGKPANDALKQLERVQLVVHSQDAPFHQASRSAPAEVKVRRYTDFPQDNNRFDQPAAIRGQPDLRRRRLMA
jgi:hypothetical protein